MSVLAKFYQDIEVGAHYDFGSRVFKAEHIKKFAASYDPQAFHMDEEAAKDSHFGALCASGWQTASTWMRFYADHNMALRKETEDRGEPLPVLGVSPGIEKIKWSKPVYVGDEITYSQTITTKRELKSRPGWGMVISLSEGRNQDGEIVLSFVSKNLVQVRGSES